MPNELPDPVPPSPAADRGGPVTRVALLHTVAALPAVFGPLLADEVGPVDAVNMVDESLLRDTVRHGMLPRTRRRVASYAAFAEESGARALLVTCSSIGEAAEYARAQVDIPVYRVDEPMAEQAVRLGRRIGVLATLAATAGPTLNLLRRKAEQLPGDGYQVRQSLCAGAFEALQAGDPDGHDRIVAAEVGRLAGEVDVLVLAQASMARVIDALPPGRVTVPVLSSPRSGTGQLRHISNAGQ